MQNVQEVVSNALSLHSSEISTLKEIIAKQESSIAKLMSLTTVQQVRMLQMLLGTRRRCAEDRETL